MPRLVEPIEIWGTVVLLDLEGDATEAAREAISSWLVEVDLTFSTYISTSEISALRAGELIVNTSPVVQQVWNECLRLRDLTQGAFDPWAAPGGFDPSGYVKGWAADRAREIAQRHEIKHGQINAGGDVVVFGGKADGSPWHLGVRHPDIVDAIATTVSLIDGALAGSGNYERGAHIVDPNTGLPAIGARATAVVGPDAGVADALATAFMVAGRRGTPWLIDMPEYSVWGVDFSGDQAWHVGGAFS